MNQSASERKKFHQKVVKAGAKVKLIKPKFAFGKYKGKTVAWVFKQDPDYIVWCYRTVSRSYWPKGFDEELFNRALGITEKKNSQIGRGRRHFNDGDYELHEDDLILEQWARGIADE